MADVDISFVIPAYNEQQFIGSVIDRIYLYVPNNFKFEIIVCDNGSKDLTVPISLDRGAEVISMPDANISALRNAGAKRALGDVLVFLDADIFLTPAWRDEFVLVYMKVLSDVKFLTGSRYSVDDTPSWIEKHWFDSLVRCEKEYPSYINSGHLIISRMAFINTGGFNEELDTGEDYEFCQRFIKLDGVVFNNKKLEVIHKGYPKTIQHFCKREAWHGKGDYKGVKEFFTSKTALMSVAVFLLSFLAILLILFGLFVYSIIVAVVIFVLLIVSVYKKFEPISTRDLLTKVALMYLYFISRASSISEIFNNRSVCR